MPAWLWWWNPANIVWDTIKHWNLCDKAKPNWSSSPTIRHHSGERQRDKENARPASSRLHWTKGTIWQRTEKQNDYWEVEFSKNCAHFFLHEFWNHMESFVWWLRSMFSKLKPCEMWVNCVHIHLRWPVGGAESAFRYPIRVGNGARSSCEWRFSLSHGFCLNGKPME